MAADVSINEWWVVCEWDMLWRVIFQKVQTCFWIIEIMIIPTKLKQTFNNFLFSGIWFKNIKRISFKRSRSCELYSSNQLASDHILKVKQLNYVFLIWWLLFTLIYLLSNCTNFLLLSEMPYMEIHTRIEPNTSGVSDRGTFLTVNTNISENRK